MNPRTQRQLILAAVLLLALVAVVLVLNRDKADPQEVETPSKQESLSAIKSGSGNAGSGIDSTGTVEVKPVEVNARTLLAGAAMLELSPEEVEQALDATGRSAGKMIAAQALLGDYNYLRDAAEQHPDNPNVHFWILSQRVMPEERGAWLEKFKAADPDNALANYLAAEQAFRSMDYEAGIGELKSAIEKGYRDYSDSLQDDVKALYEASGKFGAGAARNGSARAVSMPHVEQIQSLSQGVIQQYQKLVADEKHEAAAELVNLGMAMLETVAGNSKADAIESRTLMLFMQENMQRAAGDPSGQLENLAAERKRLGELNANLQKIFSQEDLVDEIQLNGYAERLHGEGEVAAAEWLVEQVGEIPELEGGE